MYKSVVPEVRGYRLRLYIPNVGGDIPLVTECICHARSSIAIGLVGRFGRRSGSGVERSEVHCIRIRDVQVEHGGHGLVRPVGLAHLQGRVADPDLGVMDHALRRGIFLKLLGAEGAFQEVDYGLGSTDAGMAWLCADPPGYIFLPCR